MLVAPSLPFELAILARLQRGLVDLRELAGNVLNSDVLVLLQSTEALLDPRCLLELYTAATAGIPISAARSTSSPMRIAPSSMVSSEWTWRWTKSASGSVIGCGDEPSRSVRQIEPLGLERALHLAVQRHRRHLAPIWV